MNTSERLPNYYDFDSMIVDRIATTAANQNHLSFHELADQYCVSNGPQSIQLNGRTLEYYMIHPRATDYHDAETIRVYPAPMATPADQNMAMRAFRLHGADPSTPIMVVGMPAAIGHRANIPSTSDIPAIWHGNFASLAVPALRFLQSENIESCDFVGHSFGADVAATAASLASEYGITAKHGIWMEPTSVVTRSVGKLAAAFASSGKELKNYVDATESQVFKAARNEADTGLARYVGGLLRVSNIAITHALATASFEGRAKAALTSQKAMKVAIVWGGKSELTDNAAAEAIVGTLRARFGADRVGRLRIAGMHHAGGDDIDLHAAMVLQAQADFNKTV